MKTCEIHLHKSNVGNSHGDCNEVEHVRLNTTHIVEVASLLVLLLQKLLLRRLSP
jgi:hypothetical protein